MLSDSGPDSWHCRHCDTSNAAHYLFCHRCGKIRTKAVPRRTTKPQRRNETRDLTKPIEAALNAIPGVWASRNTVGIGYHRNGDPATWGLGTGSADIIGCAMGYFFALEVKWPGESPTPQQRSWLRVMSEEKGALVAVVHSVEEAKAAIAPLLGDCA